jgi:hypothetical protein
MHSLNMLILLQVRRRSITQLRRGSGRRAIER